MTNKIVSLLFLLSVVSCNRLVVQQQLRNTTTNQTALGVVGRVSGVFADQDFRTEAFPEYKNDIKVEVTFMPFNKMSYNAYKRAAEKQNNIVAFQWDKENETQPQFI